VGTSEPGQSRGELVVIGAQGPRQRVLRYLYSTRNRVGCLAGLGGLGLYFTGVVGDLWPVVVAGLYGAGALATPPAKVVNLRLGLDPADLGRAMAEQKRRIQGKVPDDVLAAVLRIHAILGDVLAHHHALPPGSPDAYVVERTALDYLPTALESYLALPRSYANRVTVSGDRTARQVLLDQLRLMESKLGEVLEAALRGDTDRLLAHGRFLEDRFASSELRLEPGGPGIPGQPGDPDARR